MGIVNNHNCCNCKYLDVLPDEPLSFRFDCFCPDFDWGNDFEHYWDAWKVNDCRHFTHKDCDIL